MEALYKIGFPVPAPICYCSDANVIGTEFYINEYVIGRIFLDPSLNGVSPKERSEIYKEMISVLSKLHKINPIDIGLSDFGKSTKNYWFCRMENYIIESIISMYY